MNDNTYKPLPILEGHKCFACGHMNPSGLRMEFSTDETCLISELTVPGHMRGWNKMVHGGIVATILDEIMGWGAIYLLKKVILTKSVTINFVKPVIIDTKLKAESRVLEIVSDREAVMAGTIFDEAGTILAEAKGIFALLTPEVGIKLKVVDENALRDLHPLITTETKEE